MRKSFWLFAIVLSMSLGIRAQAAPREIPDHFNTGVDTDTELTEIPEPGIYGGIQYKTGAGGQLALDLVYSNRQAGNEIEIRNMDFSRYALLMVNEGKIAVETTVTFRNCKFDAVTTGREDARISYVFEDCTLRNFQGSNATFTRCRLGGSSGDALCISAAVVSEEYPIDISLFTVLCGHKPSAFFKPEITLLPPYPTGIPVSHATHALTGSAAYIQYLVNVIPSCLVKFDLNGTHFPTCIKMHRHRHIPLFKLHSFTPYPAKYPTGCTV